MIRVYCIAQGTIRNVLVFFNVFFIYLAVLGLSGGMWDLVP